MVKGEPAVVMVVQVEGASYRFNHVWNERTASWYLDVFALGGAPVLAGVRVDHMWPLWGRHLRQGLPPGNALAVDMASSGAPPTFESWGGNTRLVYYTASEVAADRAQASATAPRVVKVGP